ncbi:uncharacterized protein [Clytia hemisphaerica]|uniref:uncharacterized protein n=1 Tax=Clytia hemisphaerica TaxID=252671 RepID=UPI0034D448EC
MDRVENATDKDLAVSDSDKENEEEEEINSSGSAEKFPSEESNSIDNFSDNDIDLTSENTNNDNDTVLQDYEMDQNVQPIGGSPNIPEAININAVSVSTNASIKKCFGYVPALAGEIYSNFPFQLLSTTLNDIVFENGAFHAKECVGKNYILHISYPFDVRTNKECLDLKNHNVFQSWVTSSNDMDKHTTTAKSIYLTHEQLCKRVVKMGNSLNNYKLKFVSATRKLNTLNKSLELHKRFMLLVKDNSIPKLHEIVKVAMNRRRGLQYTINKIIDAIDGVYNPHSSEDDKDLAFLILQYGGPSLLDIVHKALKFPSTSTAYRLLQGSTSMIKSSINTDPHEFIKHIVVDPGKPKYGYMLKIDETFLEPKVRWNPKDDSLYGICYEHGREVNMNFESYQHVQELSNQVKDGKLHVPKETMVIVCSNNTVKARVQVVAALPTCSKNEIEYQKHIVLTISKEFFKVHKVPLLNWATDGDATRRMLFDQLMCYDLPPTSPIYDTISKLKLVDMKVGPHDETVNFDHKHIAKRIRGNITNNNFRIGDRTMLRSDVEKILSLAPNETKFSNSSLICPKDKQNVPLATTLLFQFVKAVRDVDTLKTINLRVADVSEELHLLGFIIEAVLACYATPDTTIKSQLEKISLAAHILLILKRELKSFLNNQLYHDLQATFSDAFFCATKWKYHHPDVPFFIMLCSNDTIERFFGNLRLKYKQSVVDNLELIYATRSIQLCTDMMYKHPNWFEESQKIMKRLCLDYCSPGKWDLENLVLKDVPIVAVWNQGRALAEYKFNQIQKYQGEVCDFNMIASLGYTLLCPNGIKIGLTDTDTSEDDNIHVNVGEGNTILDDTDIEDRPATSLIDMIPEETTQKHDVQTEIDGSRVYKATIVKSLFSSNPLSKDRLRKVRGMTKFTEDGQEASEAIETSIMPGDPILFNVKGTLKIVKISVLKKATRKVKMVSCGDISNENVYVKGAEMGLDKDADCYIWNGSLGEMIETTGPYCYAIQPDLKTIKGKLMFTFDKQLILDLNVGLTIQNPNPGSSSSTSSHSNQNSSSATGASENTNSSVKKASSEKKGALKHVVECCLCKERILLSNMRKHIGIHITKSHISGCNICGFCGRTVCNTNLTNSSKRGNEQYNQMTTNCKYNSFIQRKPVHSQRSPCSNHVVPCPVCKVAIWTYNARAHYEGVHPTHAYNDSDFVSPQERQKMKSISKAAKIKATNT